MASGVHGTSGHGHVDTRGLHVLALPAGLWFAISPAVYDEVWFGSSLWNHIACGVAVGSAATVGLLWTAHLVPTRRP